MSGWHTAMTSPLMPSASNMRLRSSALTLALAGGIDYGLQLVVPFFLVRFLDPSVFGQYRFLWLMAGTALAIAPAFMPQALFYFLPRAEPANKGLLVGNVLVYLAAAACVVGAVTLGWNPLLPVMAENLFFQTHSISTIFLALWVVASLFDVLPTAEERTHWHARAMIALSVCRTLLLAGVAMVTSEVLWVVSAMLAVAVVKIVLLAYYMHSRRQKTSWQLAGIKMQLAYCLPFALCNTFLLLRIQADQWVVASMLLPAQYAVFSIAAAVLPVAPLISRPVINAMMPDLNRVQSRGDFTAVSQLIAKTNGAIALFLLPISGGLFAVTPELVDIVYTSQYRDAAPIMRVYLIGMMMAAFAVGYVLPALERGRFAAINSAVSLVLSIVLSIVGINQFGMVGAALGSVLTMAISEFWSMQVVSRMLGIKMSELLAWKKLRSTLVATAMAMIGVLLLGELVSGKSFPMLVVKGLAYVVLFAACFFPMWRMPESNITD